MNKVAIIVAYFGKLPEYIDLFLRSCENNEEYDFLIFTDNLFEINYKVNLRFYNMKFAELNVIINSKLGIDIKINKPYKLCDYRPAFGKIFEDYLTGYEFWGHCDIDMILGDLDKFLTQEIYNIHEKILINGHLSIYKNTEIVNNYYKIKSNKYINFDEVIKINEPCFFDEKSIINLLEENKIKIYENFSFADILPQYLDFKLSKICNKKNEKKQSFYFEDGHIYREYLKNSELIKDEFMYIHFQKRKMLLLFANIDNKDRIYITPKGFEKQKSNNLVKVPRGKVKYFFKYYINKISKTTLNTYKIKINNKFKLKLFSLKYNI